MSLKVAGTVPGGQGEFLIYDVVHVDNGRWALVETDNQDPPTFRTTLSRPEEWRKPLGQLRYDPSQNESTVANSRATADGNYRVGGNLLFDGVPPVSFIGANQPTLLDGLPSSVMQLHIGMISASSVEMMPTNVDHLSEGWFAQDGTASRWAHVSWGLHEVYVPNFAGLGPAISPDHGVIIINGRYYPVPGWVVTSADMSNGTSYRWVRSPQGPLGWTWETYNPGMVSNFRKLTDVQIGIGPGYAVGFAVDGELKRTSIAVVERSTGKSWSALRQDEVRVAGPLVRGGRAIYYMTKPSEDGQITYRVEVNLATKEFRQIRRPSESHTSGFDAPSYMTDVPRTAAIQGAGTGLVMDGDFIKIDRPVMWSISGAYIVVGQQDTPTRSRGRGVNNAVIVRWTPDGDLGDGRHEHEGHFS